MFTKKNEKKLEKRFPKKKEAEQKVRSELANRSGQLKISNLFRVNQSLAVNDNCVSNLSRTDDNSKSDSDEGEFTRCLLLI